MSPASLKLNALGTYLDHPHGAIYPWANRVPYIVYPTILGAQVIKDVVTSKDKKERNERLKDHAIRMGIPTAATIAATWAFMSPEAEAFNTTHTAAQYFDLQNRDVFTRGQTRARNAYAPLKALKAPLWGRLNPDEKLKQSSALPTFQSVEEGVIPLDVQVGGVIRAIRKDHETRLNEATEGSDTEKAAFINKQFTQLHTLKNAAHVAVLENALTATDEQGKQLLPVALRDHIAREPQLVTGMMHLYKHIDSLDEDAAKELKENITQFELPSRIEDDVRKMETYLQGPDSLTKKMHSLTNTLMRHETRLALPTDEDLSDFAGAFENGRFKMDQFGHAMQRTASEFLSEAAGPFLLVGGASVGSGIAAGFIANKLEGKSEEKNGAVIKEGIFQYVANIAMCGFGAGAGLAVANSLGFTKFRNPAARFGTIVAGLGAGIYAGAKIANPLSEKVDTVINHHREKKRKPVLESGGRTLEMADGVLHVDDVPTAFSVAGVQALKPWISPFFLMSGIKTAFGYRNVSPLVHLSPFPADFAEAVNPQPVHKNKLVEADASVDYEGVKNRLHLHG